MSYDPGSEQARCLRIGALDAGGGSDGHLLSPPRVWCGATGPLGRTRRCEAAGGSVHERVMLLLAMRCMQIYVCMFMYMYMYVCVCVCVCVYVCVYMSLNPYSPEALLLAKRCKQVCVCVFV